MKFDIYFHNDFDGRASAAVMLNFLESRGDVIENYIPVDFDIKKRWLKFNFDNPFIVVDFLYQPRAIFWFDHHPTTFLEEKLKKDFQPDKFKVFDITAPSACGLVLKTLMKNFGYNPPRYIKELAKWLDIIDMARYHSAKQTIEKKETALQFEEFVDSKKNDSDLMKWFLKKLASESMKKISQYKKVSSTLKALKKKKETSLRFYRKNIKLYKKIAYIDLSQKKIPELRFAPFYFYPKTAYAISLKKRGDRFHLNLGVNPWLPRKKKISVGKFLEKHYDGGGHEVVGGADFKTRLAAEKAIEEILSVFQK